MQPRINAGDLVIARASSQYTVGDVVAYKMSGSSAIALHRIVAVSPDGRFTLKGDNNDFLDPDQPTAEAIVGKEWLHIPHGGIWLKRIANPVNLAALVFLLLIASSAAEANTRRVHRRRRMPDDSGGKAVFKPWWSTLAPATRTLLVASSVVALVGLALSLLTFTRAATVRAATSQKVAHSMEFSYSAEVTPSAAYQDSEVTSPTPIFRTQVDAVDVNYAYQGPPGTISVTAKLATDSGWTWDLPLAEPETFTGNEYAGSVRLDLAEISQLAQRGGKATGLPSDQVAIAVTPTVQTDDGAWQPKVDLNLTPQLLTLADPGALKVDQSTDVATTTATDARVRILGLTLPVLLARLVSVLILLLGLAGLAYGFLAGKREPVTSEADMIQMQYGSLIVPVSQPPTIKGMVIDVPDIGSLAKMAQRYVLLILMARVNGMDVFIVQDEDVAYRYVSKPAQMPSDSSVGTLHF